MRVRLGQTGSTECTPQRTAIRLSVWEAERGSRRTRRHRRDDPRAEGGEEVRVRVAAVECQLNEYGRTLAFCTASIMHASCVLMQCPVILMGDVSLRMAARRRSTFVVRRS